MLFSRNRSLAFLIFGESNSGGFANNAELSAAELLPQEHVKILNNSNLEFEPLEIGTNNLINHTSLPDNATHGFEFGIASGLTQITGNSLAYVVKAGQGGSRLSQWPQNGGFWPTLINRVNTARALLPAGRYNLRWVALHTIGINDEIAGLPADDFKVGIEQQHQYIRELLGPNTLILSPRFMEINNRPAYNQRLEQIASFDPLFRLINTSDATLRDNNHWDSAGVKLIGERMLGEALRRAL